MSDRYYRVPVDMMRAIADIVFAQPYSRVAQVANAITQMQPVEEVTPGDTPGTPTA